MNAVVLRVLDAERDRRALRRLADRDCAAPLTAPVLGAEVEGEVRAAICLETGRVVADPFRPTADLVELLRTRAAQLRAAPRRGVPARGRAIGRSPRWGLRPAERAGAGLPAG